MHTVASPQKKALSIDVVNFSVDAETCNNRAFKNSLEHIHIQSFFSGKMQEYVHILILSLNMSYTDPLFKECNNMVVSL